MTNEQSKPTWYILGAGAIGCLWASYWRQAGFRVVLITSTERSANCIELQRDEQTVSCAIEQLTVEQLLAAKPSIDHLFISTKAQHTVAALQGILPSIIPAATVLVVQNGMAAKKIPPLLTRQTLYTGITTDGAYRTAPLTVVHAGRGDTYIDCDAKLLEQLPVDYLNIFPCVDIEQRQWQKLVVNCAINALTAIYQCRNGELLYHPEAQQRIDAICQEASNIAQAIGIASDHDFLRAQITQALTVTAENYSSMYQDIAGGRSTEIDYLNGYLCELATSAGVACEENQRLVDSIRQLQNQTADKQTPS